MSIRSQPWRFVLGTGLLAVVGCGFGLWLIILTQERLNHAQARADLLTQARLVRDLLSERWPEVQCGQVPECLHTLTQAGIQIAVLDTGVEAWVDSSGRLTAEELLRAPETRTAFEPGRAWGSDTRRWGPEGARYVMVALRAGGAEADAARVVWLARPVWTYAGHPDALLPLAAGAAAVAGLATVGLGWLYFRLRRRIVGWAVRTVRQLTSGNLAAEVERPETEAELTPLGSALRALRRRLAAQVRLSEDERRLLQSLVNELEEGLVVTREDGRLALINPAAIRMLNLEPAVTRYGTLIGQPIETCIPHHPLQRLLSRASGGVDGAAAERVRVELDSSAGAVTLLARATDVVLPEGAGGPECGSRGRALMLTDITELQRIIQVRTDFVANASHELRTPLSTIRAAVETLLTMDLAAEAPAARAFLEKVDRHSARLEMMVGDLLDLSRVETPSERFEPEEVDVRRLAADVHARFAERIERKGLHWCETFEPEGLRTILVNPRLIRLVLDNLVDNAIKFTDAGGHVALRISRMGDTVLEVTDDGCGIPEEDQQRVFERFYQVQRARSGPDRGTGLGLSIVRHAVVALKGTVRLESKLHEGTRVTVTIPAPGAREAAVDEAAAAAGAQTNLSAMGP